MRHTTTRGTAVAVVLGLLLSACTFGDEPAASPDATDEAGPAGQAQVLETTGPLRVRLAAGEPIAAAPAPTPVVLGDALSEDRIAEILARLPEFAPQGDDRQPVNLPTRSLPPPTAATTVDAPFPPPDDSSSRPEDPGPLEVVRHQPDGEVTVAPFLSVTFNQDVIPLGTLEQLDEGEAPGRNGAGRGIVAVTPDLPGRWRWIGTRTLRYEHVSDTIDRLPAATEYTVEIPAGTSSVDGDELAEPFRWTFTTPAPTVTSVVPEGNSLPLEPVFVATFDQRVDPAAVLTTTTLTVDGQDRPVRLATAAEVEGDDTARQAMGQALEGRAIALRPEAPLPTDARIVVTFGPGTPSAEGPRTTEEAQTHSMRTHGALRVVRDECGYGDGCRPGHPFQVTFSNPLDLDHFDPEAFSIEPTVSDAGVSVHGDLVVVNGSTRANTSYHVTIPADLRDTFGQTLGEEETLTFEVRAPQPELREFSRTLTTVDPLAATPGLSVVSVGHEQLRVRLMAVTPDNWPAYQDWFRNRLDDSLDDLPSWPVAVERTVDTEAGPDGLPVETVLDLREALDGTTGHVVVTVETTEQYPRNSEAYWHNRPAVTWAQVTSLGVDAFADSDQLVTWVTDLADGTPVAEVTILAGSATSTTDAHGLATTELGAVDHIVARRGDDEAILARTWGEPWTGHDPQDQVRWYTIDDRGLYRPGETIHLKGVVRRVDLADNARVVGIGGQATVRYQAHDALGASIGEGTTTLSELGTFDLELEIPEGSNLGQAELALHLEGAPGVPDGMDSWHGFTVDEFRRPTFEVVARAESDGPHMVTEPATVAVDATYLAGGALGAAPVTWTVSHQDTTYAPPNWPGFTFGEWIPWWIHAGGFAGRGIHDVDEAGPFFEEDCCFPPGEEPQVERFDATTDAAGSHFLQVDLQGERPDQPISVRANAAVTDVNDQQLAGTVDLLVHPARLYVGLRTDRTFVREGEDLDVDLVVATIDGELVDGRDVTVTAARLEQQLEDGAYTEVPVDEQTCTATSADEPVSCSFGLDVGGEYRITAEVTDDDGGRQRSVLTRWVSGAGSIPTRTVEQETLTLVPDRETYAVGDTASLLVAAPFDAGHGLVTITRGDIVSTEVFEVVDGSAVLDVPITDALVGGAHVHVTVDGAAERLRDDGTSDESLPPRPAYAAGEVILAVPPTARTLTVTADPREETVTPGDATTLDVSVTGPDGEPADGSEVAVIVADEAVLSLIGRTLTNPVDVFHAALASNLRIDLVRGTIVLSRPEDAAKASGDQFVDFLDDGEEVTDATAGGDSDGRMDEGVATRGSVQAPVPMETGDLALTAGQAQAAAAPIALRANFDPLALFAPAVVTDADGRATVEVTVPDNLTRYRVMAVAVHGEDRFGLGEAALTARLPLMVRPSPPRFLNFGDRFEFRTVLHNQTDADLDSEVLLQGTNLAIGDAGTDVGGQRVLVPANDRVEVRIPVTADDAGTARFRVAAVSGDLADAAEGDLPVYTPVTTEAFATYGVLDGTPGAATSEAVAAHRLLAPTGVVPQFGGLQVSTAATSLATLTDAVLYIDEFPYESADAFASRVLTIAALRDVLEAFGGGANDRAEVDTTAQDDLDALAELQHDDGGFGYWRREGRSEPFVSAHAVHALVAGRDAGYRVNGDTVERGLTFLREIEGHIPRDWDQAARHSLIAYALHVRDRAGDRDVARAEQLYREDPDLPLDAIAWIWPLVEDAAVVGEIARTVGNRVTETPSAAVFTTDLDESAHLVLASDRRTDGLMLDALIRMRPDSDLIPKVVTGLIGNQRKGHWRTVQENTFILLALKRYFDTYEATSPEFVARAWLGDQYLVEHAYPGRTTERQQSTVPMADLVAGGDRDLVVANDGTGRLYYRLGLDYAPDDLALEARDEGFVVDRTYEAVDDPEDVRRDPDGTWHLRTGANVRVRLTMVADSQRVNMALVDHLPAGLESVNPTFATAPDIRPEETDEDDDISDRTTSWWGPWFDHQNLRDDRAEAFSNHLPAGTYEYTYVARTTTPGTFVVPPAKAEEIDAPEVFGRSATDRVVVE